MKLPPVAEKIDLGVSLAYFIGRSWVFHFYMVTPLHGHCVLWTL